MTFPVATSPRLRGLAAAAVAAGAVAAMSLAGAAGAATTPYPTAVLADAPVAYWRLGEATGTVAADSSTSAVAATYTAVTLKAAGALAGDTNTAITLAGTGYAEAPVSAKINPTGAVTVEAWAKVTVNNAKQRAVVTSRSTDNTAGYYLFADAQNRWSFAVGNGTSASWIVLYGPALTLNAWTHLVATDDGTTMRLYVNGVLAGSAAAAYKPNLTRTTRIGMGMADTTTSLAFTGSIDEVAVYGKALDATRALQHYAAGLNITGAPVASVVPKISGTAVAGQTLSTTSGTWSNSPSSTAYQWQRCDAAGANCAPILGATAASYAVAFADIGFTLRSVVTATNVLGSGTAASLVTAVVPTPPANTVLPAITGTAKVGQALSLSTGTWTGTAPTFTRQWKRCDATGATCVAISGATAATYTLAVADQGSTIRGDVKATNAAGTATATSAPTAAVAAGIANTVLPVVTGTAKIGSALTTSTGTWSATVTSYAYQWKRCDSAGASCTAIAGATAAAYTVTTADGASTLRADVKATSSTLGNATATTAATAIVPPASSVYAPIVQADAPLSYWRLNESTGTVAADAVGGRPGAYKASPLLGQPGPLAETSTAVAFNGTTQYVEVPYSAALNPAGAVSIEAWVKVTGGQGTMRSIVTSRDFTTLSTGYSLYASDANQWSFIVGVGGSNMWVYTSGGTVTLNKWTHLVATYEQWPGEYRLYVDGKAVAVTTSPYLMQPNTKWPLRIAAGKTESATPTFFTPAAVDEVAVYGKALTPVQVANHYATGITARAPGAAPTPVNPIQAENQLPGTSAWKRAPTAAVEGYASTVSALPGESVALHVSAKGVSYRVDLYRLGWYGGLGGRLISCTPSCTTDRTGTQYPVPAPDPVTGLVAAGWPVTDTVTIPASAPSGMYIAQLVATTGADAGKASFVPIVVREPMGYRAKALVEVPVNTWQAYNGWGGKSLYAINSTGGVPAVKVSFDRPYLTTNSPMWWWDAYTDSPGVMDWEIQLYRFLEREGVDISYQTNVDTVASPATFLGRKTLIDAGHDEYWSKEEMDAWYAARDSGVNLMFFGGSLAYWQSRYEDGGRTLVEYRSPGTDPIADQTKATYRFSVLGRPECQLIGTGNQEGVATDHRNYTVVTAALADPWMAGTGFVAGDQIPDGVGYEWQGIQAGCIGQPITSFFHYDQSLNASTGITMGPADVTRYTAASGARVFSASSLQFTWALDDFLTDRAADARVQQLVRNVLADVLR